MPAECPFCEGSGKVNGEGTPYTKIAAKDGQRPAWVGLLSRTEFFDCPVCLGRGKRGPGRPRKVVEPAAEVPEKKPRGRRRRL